MATKKKVREERKRRTSIERKLDGPASRSRGMYGGPGTTKSGEQIGPDYRTKKGRVYSEHGGGVDMSKAKKKGPRKRKK